MLGAVADVRRGDQEIGRDRRADERHSNDNQGRHPQLGRRAHRDDERLIKGSEVVVQVVGVEEILVNNVDGSFVGVQAACPGRSFGRCFGHGGHGGRLRAAMVVTGRRAVVLLGGWLAWEGDDLAPIGLRGRWRGGLALFGLLGLFLAATLPGRLGLRLVWLRLFLGGGLFLLIFLLLGGRLFLLLGVPFGRRREQVDGLTCVGGLPNLEQGQFTCQLLGTLRERRCDLGRRLLVLDCRGLFILVRDNGGLFLLGQGGEVVVLAFQRKTPG